ncbi:HIT family protein [Candidatus Woesearchaeota archaeon]|nr:HIT family protein [Candidatus Woesearchaeota archaeon]
MVDAPPELTEEQRRELEKKLKSMTPDQIQQLQKQQCIFCQIISGKIPSKKVYEDHSCLAVLDINPATRGHLLLLPKEHYAIMPQVPQKELEHLFSISKLLSRLQLRALRVSGTNIFIANGPAAGQRAQHFMIHLLPRKEGDHLLPVKDKLIDPSLLEKVKDTVQDRLSVLLGKRISSRKEDSTEPASSKPELVEKEMKKQQKPKKNRASKKREIKEESEEQKEENSDPTASLDEIAELFK